MVLTTSNHDASLAGSVTMENVMNVATSLSPQTSIPPIASHMIPKRKTRDLIDCMDVADRIGTGTYGVVYKAIEKTDPHHPIVALKKIKMERETQGFPVTAIREIKILHLMNHENVIKLREIITYDKEGDEKQKNDLKLKEILPGDVFMVFEYVEYDLDGLLKSINFHPSSEIIKSYMHQLLSGIQYLHEKKIIHRDIKSANLLISKNNILKIADWGLARALPPPNHKLTVPVVTLWYRSPELVFGTKHYGTEIDMWSVGCIFAELKQKSELFRAGTEAEIIELIFRLLGTPQGPLLDQYKTYPDWEKINFTKQYQSRLMAEFGRQYDALGLSLLEGLLDLNPTTRISAKDALEHRYFLPETVIPPSSLPVIDLAPVTGWSQQEKVKKEREEQRKAAELQHQLQSAPVIARPVAPPPPPPAVQGTARSKTARDRDRENNPKLTKFNIIKKPAAPPSNPPPPAAPFPPGDRREEDRSSFEDLNAPKRQRTESYPLSSSGSNPQPPPPPPPPLGPPPPAYAPPGGHHHHHHHHHSHPQAGHHSSSTSYPPRSPRSHHSSSYSHHSHHDTRPPPPAVPPHPHHNSSSSSSNRDHSSNSYYRR